MAATSRRCNWANKSTTLQIYHDTEWGNPEYRDLKLFELLILEGHQAGLSWEIILNKRVLLNEAYYNFNPEKLIKLTEEDLNNYYIDDRVIKNKLKIKSVYDNARAYFIIKDKYGSLSKFLWQFVGNKPIINNWDNLEEVPTKTKLSEQISKALKKYGFKFVGPTIVYSFMQAVGMINDHVKDCTFK